MVDKITIEIDVEEVNGEFRYCASIKEMPGCFTEASELQTCLKNIYEAISLWQDANL